MKSRGRGYLTRMGLKNIIVNRTMSIASVLVLVSCLMLTGLVFLMAINFNYMFRELSSYNVIRVFLVQDIPEEQRVNLQHRIQSLENVRDVTYVSSEEAFARMQHTNQDEFRLLADRDAFLPESFEVSPLRLAEFDMTYEQLRNFDPAIESVRHLQGVAQQLRSIETALLIIMGTVVTVLLLVSIFIISSTVQTTMYSRQQEIKVMKSVGAAPAFIRWPFLVEGVCIGMLGATLSFALVSLVYMGLTAVLEPVLSSFMGGYSMLSFGQQLHIMLPLFFGVGLLTGGGGSMLSITRYLKEKVYENSELDEA